MLELIQSELELKFKGQVYKLSYPTVGQLVAFSKEEKKVGPDGAMDVLKDFLSKLGLPGQAFDQLQSDHLEMIVSNLKGQKKA